MYSNFMYSFNCIMSVFKIIDYYLQKKICNYFFEL